MTQDSKINRPENKKGCSSGTEAAPGLQARDILPPASAKQPHQQQVLHDQRVAQPPSAMTGRAFLSASARRKTTHILQAGGAQSEGSDLQGWSTAFAHRHAECFKKAEVFEISDERVHTAMQSSGRHRQKREKTPNQNPVFLSHIPFLVNIKSLLQKHGINRTFWIKTSLMARASTNHHKLLNSNAEKMAVRLGYEKIQKASIRHCMKVGAKMEDPSGNCIRELQKKWKGSWGKERSPPCKGTLEKERYWEPKKGSREEGHSRHVSLLSAKAEQTQ